MQEKILTSLFMLIFFFSSLIGIAQTRTIKGKVMDGTGETMPGATILIKGTSQGVVTDINGAFEISAKESDVLVFSFVGYQSKEVLVGKQLIINVKLASADTKLDEVVVVGYGTQSKKSIVGAVTQIKGDIVQERPNANIVRSIQGQLPGVNITLSDGKPSRSSEINIRGAVNSVGAGGSALVLVDGVEGDITTVNPSDIASISVLKDASSCAVYGARGAFGVVLITTKNPAKGKVNVEYGLNYSFLSRTVKPDLVTNGYEWYKSYKESFYGAFYKNPNSINNIFPWNNDWAMELEKRSKDDTYEEWRVNSNGRYEYFGNTDWHDIVYADFTTSQQHNISVSGGNDIADILVSGRYFNQGSIYNAGNERFKQYNLRAKGSLRLNKWLTLTNNMDLMKRTYHQPRVSCTYQDRLLTINRMLEHQGYPVTLEKNPDGTWTETAAYIGWAGFVEGDTYQENKKFDIKNTLGLKANIIKDVLVANIDYSYLYNYSEQDRINNQHNYSNGPGLNGTREEISDMERRTYQNNYWATNGTLTYSPRINQNNKLKILVGINAEERTYLRSLYRRDGLLVPKQPNFSLMDGTNYEMKDNGSYSWAYIGTFFRTSYSYKDKYLAEVSGRYDGSSKFPTSQQWGFFPSASLGWRLSEENFMDFSKSWLYNLKVRFSAGTSGNGMVDPYKYLSTMSISKSSTVLINGQYLSYTAAPTPTPKSLTWEKVTTYDLGADIDLFDGRLNLIGDIYRKYTTDMYVTGEELPAVAGYSAPKGNYADMKTKGWEVSLGWNDGFDIGSHKFTYYVKGSLWDSRSFITNYTSTTRTLPTNYSSSYYKGMEVGELWGYKVLGLFANDAEAEAWGKMQEATFKMNTTDNTFKAGDIKIADLDKSGKIDNGTNTVENHGDLYKIGNTTPRYCYSFSGGARYGNLGFSMTWQGVGQRDWYPAKESSYFWGHYGRSYGFCLPWQNENHRWTEQNQNTAAYWPRLRGYSAQYDTGILSCANDRYLQNAAYLRLKNVTIDYTLPKRWTKKIAMETVRFYVSGENLLTFTPLHKYAKNYDPEGITSGDVDFSSVSGREGDGYGYPQMKTISLGLNVSF